VAGAKNTQKNIYCLLLFLVRESVADVALRGDEDLVDSS
jgi:hypothetical protein